MLKEYMVIAINRLYGSGGRIMGKRLSAEFGIPFYDEEILTMASEASAIGEQFFRLNDEKAGNNLFFRALGGLHTSLEEPSLDDDITSPENLFRFQAKIIRQVAAKGSCIIMGRCANVILANNRIPHISIFINAPFEQRVHRVMAVNEGKMTKKQAVHMLKKMDRDHVKYYKYYTGQQWGNSVHYDLCINSASYGIDGSVELIRKMVQG